jgi:hypothetical protein
MLREMLRVLLKYNSSVVVLRVSAITGEALRIFTDLCWRWAVAAAI